MDAARAIPHDHLAPVAKLLRRSLRYWWVLIIAAILGGVAAYAAMRLRTSRFQSQTVLYYQEGLQWNQGEEGPSVRRISARWKEMLPGRARLQKTIEELGLYPRLVKEGRIAEAVEEMHNDVGFRINEGETFVISYQGDSPEQVQKVTAYL